MGLIAWWVLSEPHAHTNTLLATNKQWYPPAGPCWWPYYPSASPGSVLTRGLYHFRGRPFALKSFVGSKSRCGAGNSSASFPQHSPGGSSWTRGGCGSALLIFPFFSLLAELASKKHQLLPPVAVALMMWRAVSWEVDWHNQFISHRSANCHQIKMIFVRYRPGLDWNQWPRDERLRKKGFYLVYGHTSLLSPSLSFSCPKCFLFFSFFLFFLHPKN